MSAVGDESGCFRVALFGSPAFALPTLAALNRRHRLLMVVAQPDKRAGRGLRPTSPATVERAHTLNIPVEQPARLRSNADFAARLAEAAPDIAVTAAYGKILPAELLAIPRLGFLNVHASLLPKYRGAAPVQWALIAGEHETGITIMQTEPGLDTGPIRLQRRLPIAPDATAPELLDTLARIAAEALIEALELLARDRLPLTPQDDREASYAPMLSKDDGRIRWEASAGAIYARYRGVAGWPGSHFRWAGGIVKVPALRPGEQLVDAGPAAAPPPQASLPGTVVAVDATGVRVACGAGSIVLEGVQPAGKRAMPARDWANGRAVRPGVRLG